MPALIRAAALQLLLLVIASRVSVALHELIGHALPGAALGLGIDGVRITWFGGGLVDFSGPIPGGPGGFIVEMGGILLNLVLFLLATAVLVRRRLRTPWDTALAVFAAVNAFGATHYAVLGSFYGFGDPAAWPQVWAPSLVLTAAAIPGALAMWVRSLGRSSGWFAVPVAALALAGYGAGFLAERALTAGESEFRALQAESVAVERAVDQERERRLQEWSRDHPGEEAPPEVGAVSAADVPRPFPMTAMMLGFDVAALLAVCAVPRRRVTGLREL